MHILYTENFAECLDSEVADVLSRAAQLVKWKKKIAYSYILEFLMRKKKRAILRRIFLCLYIIGGIFKKYHTENPVISSCTQNRWSKYYQDNIIALILQLYYYIWCFWIHIAVEKKYYDA